MASVELSLFAGRMNWYARDLDRLLHGARLTRKYFHQRDTDYLVQMGHIADMLLITQLKSMVHDALYYRVKFTYGLHAKLPHILQAIKYALTVHDTVLFMKVLKVVQYHDYRGEHPEMFAQIRQVAEQAHVPMATVALELM